MTPASGYASLPKMPRRWLRLVSTPERWVLSFSVVSLGAGIAIWATAFSTELGAVLVGFALGNVPPIVVAAARRREQRIPVIASAGKVPADVLETRTVRNMQVGEIAFAVPWAVAVTSDQRAYINGAYNVNENPAGTSKMRVERRAHGFAVEVPSSYKYDMTDTLPWSGSQADDILPVLELNVGQ